MKGGMAAALGAVRALKQTGLRLRGDLWITAVVGHEEPEAKKDGPLAMIEDLREGRIQADRIVIVEGHDALWVMSMGSMLFTVELRSDRGGMHTQYVPFGENPIRFVGQMIDRVLKQQIELDRGARHPLAGPERIDLGIVHAGDYFNRTPAVCRLVGTRRWAPGRNAAEVLAELHEMFRPIAGKGGLDLQVTMEHEREPFETPEDDPLSMAVAEAHREETGNDAERIGKRIVGDANLYVSGTGIPTLYYGPSNETAHADVENVSIRLMESVARVYVRAAAKFCGVVERQ